MHKQILSILALFLVVQLLGLYVGANMEFNKAEFAELSVSPVGSGEIANSIFFLAAVVAGALFLLIVLRFYRGVLLFKLMEAMIIFVASNIVFYVVLLSLNIPLYYMWAFFISIALAGLKFFFARLKNTAAVIASAGVGAIFGFSLDLIPALIFIVGLSIYDVLAVFFTRHMLVMARELGQRNLAFSITAEQKVKVKIPSRKAPVEQKSVLELGTGDLSIPCMLAVSAFKYGSAFSPASALALSLSCIAGSSLALIIVLYAVLKNRVFLPALPPLAFGGILGIVIAKLLGF